MKLTPSDPKAAYKIWGDSYNDHHSEIPLYNFVTKWIVINQAHVNSGHDYGAMVVVVAKFECTLKPSKWFIEKTALQHNDSIVLWKRRSLNSFLFD